MIDVRKIVGWSSKNYEINQWDMRHFHGIPYPFSDVSHTIGCKLSFMNRDTLISQEYTNTCTTTHVTLQRFMSRITPVHGEIAIRSRQDSNVLTIEVENSGTAISKATIESILNRKYNSQRGTQGEKGLGIGLRLCQQLLENARGKMEIDTPSTDRMIFRIILPGF